MNTAPMSKKRLAMEVEMYSEKEGQEKLEDHEKWLAKATLDFVMYTDGGNKTDFKWDHMRDDTDGRYDQVHYLVWHFNNIMGEDNEKKEVFSDLIQFAMWAIEAKVAAMDRHFTDSVTELLKIPQLSEYHKDIRTVWNNYVQLATCLGFTICENFGFLRLENKDYDYHSHYKEQVKKLFGEGNQDRVEECLRKDTCYPTVDGY